MREYTVILTPDTKPTTLLLGRQGEYNVTKFIFDMSTYKSLYGDGTVSVIMSRAHEPQPFLVDSTKSGTNVSVVVTSQMTQLDGSGKLEIRWTPDDAQAKSAVLKTYVATALPVTVSDAPDPVYDWVVKATELYNNLNSYSVSQDGIDEAVAKYLNDNPIEGTGLTESQVKSIIIGYNYLTMDSADSLYATIADLDSVRGRCIYLSDYATSGNTDQTDNIQAALNAAAGKILYIPDGEYHFKNTLTIKSGTTIIGSGEQSVIKNMYGGTLTTIPWRTYLDSDEDTYSKDVMIAFEDDSNGISLQNFVIEGQTSSAIDASQGGLLVRGRQHTLKNITVKNINYFPKSLVSHDSGYGSNESTGYGIWIFGAERVVVENCNGYNCGYEAIGVESSNNIDIIGGSYHDCNCVPVQIHRDSYDVYMQNVQSYRGDNNKQDSTFSIHGTNDETNGQHIVQRVTAIGCYFSKHVSGIQGGENDISLINCTIDGSIFNSDDVSIGTDARWSITGCTANNINLHGIDHVILGNTITSNTDGIAVDDASSFVFANKSINNTSIKIGTVVYKINHSTNELLNINNLTPLQVRQATVGDEVIITIPFQNATAYKWVYSVDGANWVSSSLPGNDTNELTVTAKLSQSGRMYKCKITDLNDNEFYSGITKVYVKEYTSITVDSELSTDSTNPVQNNVITEQINGIKNNFDMETDADGNITIGGVLITEKVSSVNGQTGDVVLDIPKDIIIDANLSDESDNPVQNKVITTAINDVKDRLDQIEDTGISDEKVAESVSAYLAEHPVSTAEFAYVSKYASLADAIASGKTVVLDEDVELTAGISITTDGVTILGCGHTVTMPSSASLAYAITCDGADNLAISDLVIASTKDQTPIPPSGHSPLTGQKSSNIYGLLLKNGKNLTVKNLTCKDLAYDVFIRGCENVLVDGYVGTDTQMGVFCDNSSNVTVKNFDIVLDAENNYPGTHCIYTATTATDVTYEDGTCTYLPYVANAITSCVTQHCSDGAVEPKNIQYKNLKIKSTWLLFVQNEQETAIFEDCDFESYVPSDLTVELNTGSIGIYENTLFKNCRFDLTGSQRAFTLVGTDVTTKFLDCAIVGDDSGTSKVFVNNTAHSVEVVGSYINWNGDVEYSAADSPKNLYANDYIVCGGCALNCQNCTTTVANTAITCGSIVADGLTLVNSSVNGTPYGTGSSDSGSSEGTSTTAVVIYATVGDDDAVTFSADYAGTISVSYADILANLNNLWIYMDSTIYRINVYTHTSDAVLNMVVHGLSGACYVIGTANSGESWKRYDYSVKVDSSDSGSSDSTSAVVVYATVDDSNNVTLSSDYAGTIAVAYADIIANLNNLWVYMDGAVYRVITYTHASDAVLNLVLYSGNMYVIGTASSGESWKLYDTYGIATTDENGLMSAEDKTRLDTLYTDYTSASTLIGGES